MVLSLVLAVVFLSGTVFADEYTSTNFIERDPVMSVEGGRSTSANFQYLGSTGQIVIGESTGTAFRTKLGFLYFSVSTLTQTAYRWYDNVNALQPTTAKAAENTAIANVASGDVLRLRLAVRSTGEPYPKNSTFKLQYAELGGAGSCSAVPSGSFADVGAIGSAAVWRGYDNPGVADGTQIAATVLSSAATGDLQTYEEENNSSPSPVLIHVGVNADAEWDWVVQNNSASAGSTYCFRQILASGTTLNTYAVFPSLTTAPGATPPAGGGGGGGGGGGTVTASSTQVVFRGMAYPGSTVTILKDGQVAVVAPSSPDANFDISVGNLSAGTYTFGVWAQDTQQNRSLTQAFTITVTAGTTTVVSGIFLPPTIAVDKTSVERGEPLGILGQSVPSAEITIIVNSETELIKITAADSAGSWFYKLDTLELEEGDHSTKARAKTSTDISTFSPTVAFYVGTRVVDVPTVLKGDLNKDGRVNLVDFSIGAYWYRRSLSEAFAVIEAERLNGDGRIDLVDFSIMAYYWTG